MRTTQTATRILNAKASTGVGVTMLVEDFEDLMLSVNSESSANLTVKFQGSIQEGAPDFAAAQTKDNAWDNIQVRDMQNASSLDGDVGLALAGSDDHRIFMMNVAGLRWINAIVTARSAGAVTVLAKPFGRSS